MSRTTTQRTLAESAAAIAAAGPYPFELWRSIPAQGFGRSRRFAVAAYLATCADGDVEWRRAIAGDATCALRIALRMEVPEEIAYPVDARMTLLVYCALNGSAAAALVLAHLLRRMPIDRPLKDRLATSWLVRNLRSVRSAKAGWSRRRSRVRGPVVAPSGGTEDRS